MRLVRIGYGLLVRTPLRGVLRSRPLQRLKQRMVVMPPELVPEVVATLERTGVRAWIVGGWGVDALLGEHTRRHLDLDLAFDARGAGEQRAREALAGLGFHLMRREVVPGRWWSERIAFSDDSGHVVDLHPVTVSPAGIELRREAETLTVDEAQAFATGTVAGRAVSCLSATLQVALHRGYDLADADRHDLERLRERFGISLPLEQKRAPTPRPEATAATQRPRAARLRRGWLALRSRLARRLGRLESALIVPVPAAEPKVGSLRARHDPSAAGGMPAHVTVLYPFLPLADIDASVEGALASLLRGFEPFRFRLEGVDRFPGVLYLVPEPGEPFARLTAALHRRWPECPPYGGAFDAVVPHLTVAQGREPPEAAAELERGLPLEAEAAEVLLMVRGRDGRWVARRRFGLGAGWAAAS